MSHEAFQAALNSFDATCPIESSVTPPFGWYTDPVFYQEEIKRVFRAAGFPSGVWTS